LLKQKVIKRIIDANINRAKEGLRVCEDICRFSLNSRSLTVKFKRIRHKLTTLADSLGPRALFIKERDSRKDTGRRIKAGELERSGVKDIFLANIQRAKESVRVLEEFSKLANSKTSIGFKELRYKIYETEKQSINKITRWPN